MTRCPFAFKGDFLDDMKQAGKGCALCVMMTGEYVAFSATLLGTVSLACVVIFCQFENMIKKRRSAIRAIRQAGGAAIIHRLRTYVIP
jgi:hypothetical protein